MIQDKTTKVIYHYITESMSEKEIKALIVCLQDYVINGSWIDFEEDDKTLQPMIDELFKLLGF